MRKVSIFSLLLLPVSFCLLPGLAKAENAAVLLPSTAPLELNLLKPDAPLTEGHVLTSETISKTGITIPSLWWTKEELGSKLLNNWLAYPDEHRVDLVVNRQLWTLLDYVGRYRFVNRFGTVAKEYGYNTRVFNDLGIALATYTCDLKNLQTSCAIQLESSGQHSLRLQESTK